MPIYNRLRVFIFTIAFIILLQFGIMKSLTYD
jgi:hypothetical protein